MFLHFCGELSCSDLIQHVNAGKVCVCVCGGGGGNTCRPRIDGVCAHGQRKRLISNSYQGIMPYGYCTNYHKLGIEGWRVCGWVHLPASLATASVRSSSRKRATRSSPAPSQACTRRSRVAATTESSCGVPTPSANYHPGTYRVEGSETKGLWRRLSGGADTACQEETIQTPDELFPSAT